MRHFLTTKVATAMDAEENGSFMVPVVDLHQDNLQQMWPALVCAIRTASFVAIDCELSGLGQRKLINSPALDERYRHLAVAARTRAIISIGLSCFRKAIAVNGGQQLPQAPGEATGGLRGNTYAVRTFNVAALCSEDYSVEPLALRFLVEHGFDFQKQYSLGVPYHRGSDQEHTTRQAKPARWNLRDLFSVLVAAKVPLVVHNGLVDLVFLYQCLYADLPPALETFLADLEMMFPGGIYDTKYIAEFLLRTTASFLEFVFRRQQLRNQKAMPGRSVVLTHPVWNHMADGSTEIEVNTWDCSPRPSANETVPLCVTYSSHGHCPQGNACSQSHDVLRAVLQEEAKRQQKRKRRRKNDVGGDAMDDVGEDTSNSEATPMDLQRTVGGDVSPADPLATPARPLERFKGHRAGHDAFMTAFCFACFLADGTPADRPKGGNDNGGDIQMAETDSKQRSEMPSNVESARNRICVSGKNFPLLVRKSTFAKCSRAHLKKYALLCPASATSSQTMDE